MMLFFAGLPLAIFILGMLPRFRIPMIYTLIASIASAYLIRIFMFHTWIPGLHGMMVASASTALTPITIAFSAIFLFQSLERSGALKDIVTFFNRMSENSIYHVMILGWALGFFMEGLCGFGSPFYICAPLLVSLGYPPISSALFMIAICMTPISLGAVGVPTWFGFSLIGLDAPVLQMVAFKTALIHGCVGLVVPWFALRLLFPLEKIKEHRIAIAISLMSAIVPYILCARISVEFPAIVGGAVALVTTSLMAYLSTSKATRISGADFRTFLKASSPLSLSVILLLATRLPGSPVRAWLDSNSDFVSVPLKGLGTLSTTTAGATKIGHLFGSSFSAQHRWLATPSFFPFVLVALLTLWWQHRPQLIVPSLKASWSRIQRLSVFICLTLMLVGTLKADGDSSSIQIIGENLADAFGNYWQWAAPFVGAIGGFVTGSTTASNLTFGELHNSVATHLHFDVATILALQSVGSAIGTASCLNVAVGLTSVLGLRGREMEIVRGSFRIAVIYLFFALVFGSLVVVFL